jgi:hypothetical protein
MENQSTILESTFQETGVIISDNKKENKLRLALP